MPGLWLAAFCCYTLVFASLSNLPLDHPLTVEAQTRFWQLPNLVLCLFAAVGLDTLVGFVPRMKNWALPLLSVVLVAAQAGLNYRHVDASRDRVLDEIARATLESLPRDAVFLVRSDAYVNAVRYLQECEAVREDVRILPMSLFATSWLGGVIRANYPDLRLPGDGEPGAIDLLQFVELNGDREIHIGPDLNRAQRRALEGSYDLWEVGFSTKIVSKGRPLGIREFEEASRVYERYTPPDRTTLGDGTWAAFVVDRYWKNEQSLAERLSLHPVESESGRGLVLESTRRLERLIELHPDPPLKNYRTLAFAYSKLGGTDPRYLGRMVEILERYRELNPDDPDMERIEKLIRSAADS